MVTFTKEVQKAVDARKRVEDGLAWRRASAYIILHPDKKGHGVIRVAHAKDGMGTTHVFLWDMDGSNIQHGTASGCGYDKVSAAINGMTFNGIKLEDHPRNWKVALDKAGYQIIQAL